MSEKNIKHWKHLLLFKIIHSLLRIIYFSVEAKNMYSKDYDEFTELYTAAFYTEQFVFDPLGLNFDSDRLEVETESSKEYDEWITDPTTYLLTEKPPEVRREVKKIPKVLTTAYQRNFDERYSRILNYSQIYEYVSDHSFDNTRRSFKSSNYSFTSFPNLKEIYGYLRVLETLSKGRAVIIPLQEHNLNWNIVHTNSGNEILSIRISTKPIRDHEENPIIVVVAGIHGRDWYAIQSAIFVAEQLIIHENFDINEDLDWWIVPILNPDGYELSHVSSDWRDWEKNLQEKRETRRSKCFGVDLDFSFEYQWLFCNASLCDSNFPGEAPFSVPEARGLRDTLEAFSHNVNSFVALKEGRQSLVYPFSDTLETPRHFQYMNEISKEAVETFTKHVEGVYNYGQSSHLLEIRAGYIEDWAKIHLGVEKSFAFYLGPTKKNRRELKSQHLMDHTNGTFELLKIIANGRIPQNSQNSSSELCFSFIYILLILFIIEKHQNL